MDAYIEGLDLNNLSYDELRVYIHSIYDGNIFDQNGKFDFSRLKGNKNYSLTEVQGINGLKIIRIFCMKTLQTNVFIYIPLSTGMLFRVKNVKLSKVEVEALFDKKNQTQETQITE